jgi:hypothetical protein
VITIKNSAPYAHKLVGCELVNKSEDLTLSDPSGVCARRRTQVINRRGTYQLALECNASNLGWIRDILVFSFVGFSVSMQQQNKTKTNKPNLTSLTISRYIKILVEDEGAETIAPTSPYQPPQRPYAEVPSNIVPGVPLPRLILIPPNSVEIL